MHFKRSQTALGIRKVNHHIGANSGDTQSPANFNRSATAFDLRRHYAVRSLYTNTSTLYVKKKFNFRPKTALSARPLQEFGKEKTPVQFKQITSPYPEIEDDRPKRSIFKLIQLSVLYFGVEVLFSLETALTVPILLQLKVPEDVYSLVFVLSPLLGVLMQPILGIMSDSCQSRFGRRRPFILVLALGAYFGISMILNSLKLGTWLGDNPAKSAPIYGIIITGIGVTFLDFCADSSDSPLRAYILDVCNVEDQDTGLNIHAMLGGIGSALGYALAAVDWKKTFFKNIGDDFLILYVFASILFFVSLVLTLTSVKEKRFILDEYDDEKKPLINKLSNQRKSQVTLTTIPAEIDDDENNYISVEEHKIPSEKADNNLKKDELASNSPEILNDDDDDDDDDNSDRPITIKLLFQSTLNMPKELLYIMICQLLGWISYFSFTLFLTDFIGQAIYHGDPVASPDTAGYKNYHNGVKMGCWCLLSNAVSISFYAIILEKFLLNYFTTRFLYFFGSLFAAILIACIFFTQNIYIILFLCSGTGVLMTTFSTLPYQMLSEFHKDDNYRRKSAKGTKRGIGIDCSLLCACFFLAQTLVAATSSPLIHLFGDYTIIVICSLTSFINCLWISLFMIFPKQQPNEQNSRNPIL